MLLKLIKESGIYLLYDNFFIWYYKKVFNKLKLSKNREIILLLINNKIIGFTILKKTYSENKICSLYIKENFRNKGYSTYLINEAIKYLNDKYPIISIDKRKINEFKYIFKKFNFNCTSIVNYIYNNKTEIYFNEK